MARGSVVITDTGESVNVSLSFDPPIKGDAVPTPAQHIAIELFGRLVEQMKAESEDHKPCCPNGECSDKTQCWEPCGDLGKSEEHVGASSQI